MIGLSGFRPGFVARWFPRDPLRRRLPKPRPDITFATMRSLTPDRLVQVLSGEPSEAIHWITAAAHYGVAEAQLMLGQLLLDGRGTPSDPGSAFRWFGAAAGAGNLNAMNMVGRCHELGWGVNADPSLAAAWYRRAAERGLDWAQYNLANLLLRGRGVANDRGQALSLYLLAVRQGHAKSMNLVGRFHEEGWEVPADPAVALHWYWQAAEGGDFRAQFNLGTLLVRENRIAEAASWFRAALQGGTHDVVRLLAGTLLPSAEPALREVGGLALKRISG
jgi:uncharacterized protein